MFYIYFAFAGPVVFREFAGFRKRVLTPAASRYTLTIAYPEGGVQRYVLHAYPAVSRIKLSERLIG